MSMEIQRPSVRFSGRETLTSGNSYLFKPGSTVVELVKLKRDAAEGGDKYTAKLREVKSFEPHHGQTDTTGAQVPDNAIKDYTDLVTFANGETALVGMYDIPAVGSEVDKRIELDKRDFAGHTFPAQEDWRTRKTTAYVTPTEAMYRMINRFNELSQDVARKESNLQSLSRFIAGEGK